MFEKQGWCFRSINNKNIHRCLCVPKRVSPVNKKQGDL